MSAIYRWLTSIGITERAIYPCTVSSDSSIYCASLAPGDDSRKGHIITLEFYAKGSSKPKVIKSGITHYEFGGDSYWTDSDLTGNFTMTVSIGGADKLYVNVQLGTGGISSDTNRVYRDENGFLKVIT